MRSKFAIAVLLAGAMVLASSLYVRRELGKTSSRTALPEIAPAAWAPAPVPEQASAVDRMPLPTSSPGPTPAEGLTPEESPDAVEAELDRLHQWSMGDDPASLTEILNDVVSTNKLVRDAAIEAVKEFGSTNAIPALKAAADNTDDLQEKIALLEAARFLSLPSLSFEGEKALLTPEQIQADAQARAQKQARRQSRL